MGFGGSLTGLTTNLKGVYVDTITKNGPADRAGYWKYCNQYAKKHPGDIIIGVDGHNTTRIDDLISFIDRARPLVTILH